MNADNIHMEVAASVPLMKEGEIRSPREVRLAD
jgi:hypothetical protein